MKKHWVDVLRCIDCIIHSLLSIIPVDNRNVCAITNHRSHDPRSICRPCVGHSRRVSQFMIQFETVITVPRKITSITLMTDDRLDGVRHTLSTYSQCVIVTQIRLLISGASDSLPPNYANVDWCPLWFITCNTVNYTIHNRRKLFPSESILRNSRWFCIQLSLEPDQNQIRRPAPDRRAMQPDDAKIELLHNRKLASGGQNAFLFGTELGISLGSTQEICGVFLLLFCGNWVSFLKCTKTAVIFPLSETSLPSLSYCCWCSLYRTSIVGLILPTQRRTTNV